MLRVASSHHPGLEALVERHQPSTVRDRQREQVDIRDLLMSLQTVPVDHHRVRDGNVVRPERMVAVAFGGTQSVE
jgi:hypothetical protein